jgi:hypothetical protein
MSKAEPSSQSPQPKRGWLASDWIKLIVAVLFGIILLFLLNGLFTSRTPPSLLTPLSNTQIEAGLVTLSGTGIAGSQIQVLVDGQPFATTTVDSRGNWTLKGEIATPGERSVVVQEVDTAGQVLVASAPVVLQLSASQAIVPTAAPTSPPTAVPTAAPTATPTSLPTTAPTAAPTAVVATNTTETPTAPASDSTATVAPTTAAGTIAPTASASGVAVPSPLPGTAVAAAGTTARLRIVHGSPDAPAVDILVNGNPVLRNVPYFTVGTYIDLPEGTYDIQVVAAGSTGPALIAAKGVQLKAGESSTFVAGGRAATLQPIAISDAFNTPDPSKAYLRAYHLIPNAPTVNLRVANGPTLVNNLAFGRASEFVALDPGTYDLEIVDPATNLVLLRIQGAQVAAGRIFEFFVNGLVGGVPAAGVSIQSLPFDRMGSPMPASLPVTSGETPWLTLLIGLALLLLGAGTWLVRRVHAPTTLK